jgi:hypothetical protein
METMQKTNIVTSVTMVTYVVQSPVVNAPLPVRSLISTQSVLWFIHTNEEVTTLIYYLVDMAMGVDIN